MSAADSALAASLIQRLADPARGLLIAEPVPKVPFHSSGAGDLRDYIAGLIREADVLACLVGPCAHTDDWVDWQLETGLAHGAGLIGVRLRTGIHDFMPRRLVHAGAHIVDDHTGSVVAALERATFVARSGRPGNK